MIKVRGELLPWLSHSQTALRNAKWLHSPPFPPVASSVAIKVPCQSIGWGWGFAGFPFGCRVNPVFHRRSFHTLKEWQQEDRTEPRADGYSSARFNSESRQLKSVDASRLSSTKGRLTTSDLIRRARHGNIAEAETTIEPVHSAKAQRLSGRWVTKAEEGEGGIENLKRSAVANPESQSTKGLLKRQQERFDEPPVTQQLKRFRDSSESRGFVRERANASRHEAPNPERETVRDISSKRVDLAHAKANVFQHESLHPEHKTSREDGLNASEVEERSSSVLERKATYVYPDTGVFEPSFEGKGGYRRVRDAQFEQHTEDGEAAGRQPFDRRRKKKHKNELKKKDIAVPPIPGEPHWQYVVRRNTVRAEAQQELKKDVEYEQAGDDWVRKRLCWLCKEIPVLKASGLVKILNGQKKWIKQDHIKELVMHLVKLVELNRAHRVLKWMQGQPWYKFDYELHSNVAYILGRNGKVSRTQDVFDEIIRNGRVPEIFTFTALIKAYIHKGDQGDINDAWKLYNQMIQLGLKPSSSLLEVLFKGLACPTGRWLQQAEELLEKIKSLGLHVNEEMYSSLIEIHGKRGDHERVNTLIQEMEEENLEIGLRIRNAVLAACAKDGNTEKAEKTLRYLKESRLKPDWRTYVYLIQVYGTAGLHMKSWHIFEKMKKEKVHINVSAYHAITNVMANGLQVEHVLQLLTEAEDSGHKPLQPCFNSAMNMYLQLKMYGEVESMFNRGKAAKARPGHIAYNFLIKAYRDNGQLEKAESVFLEMRKKGGIGANTHTYNIMLEGYGVACLRDKVKELFQEMLGKGCQIDHHVKVHIQSMVGVKRIALLEKEKLQLTVEQREIIPGLLLGGAKMESPDKDRTYELHLEFNCENQVASVLKDHLFLLFQSWWKRNKRTKGEDEESLIEGNTKTLTRLETISHGSLRFYAHQYRPKGDPVIPKLIHRWLKPRTLAYWYMYGGRKCYRTGGIVLKASKYSGKQIQLVVKALKARTMDCCRKKKRNGDVIRFEGRSASWLWKMMEPHILEELREHLKPEEVPVDLTLAADQSLRIDEESSDEDDDWEDLVSNEPEEIICS